MSYLEQAVEHVQVFEGSGGVARPQDAAEAILLCSKCFSDHGLQLDAQLVGEPDPACCPNCGKSGGTKLNAGQLDWLVHTFFSSGTASRQEYGGAPILAANPHQENGIALAPWSGRDLELITGATGLGVFLYGPRLWMVGENEPLKELLDDKTRGGTIDRIINEYPELSIQEGTLLYRMRVNPREPESPLQYDGPPLGICGKGRLDSVDLPVLYASQDMQVCVHECRASVDDDIYVATLQPKRPLKLLNLAHVLREDEGISEFESLDIAIHMLFLAKSHSYDISRDIARAALRRGFDGIVYPSYFSLIRTGARPFETILGMSIRQIEQLEEYAANQIISNVALFGHPVADDRLVVASINRVTMARAEYVLTFGPVGFRSTDEIVVSGRHNPKP